MTLSFANESMQAEFAALAESAISSPSDSTICGVFGDWIEENGDAECGQLARSGYPFVAMTACLSSPDTRAAWLAVDRAIIDHEEKRQGGPDSAAFEHECVIRDVEITIYADEFSSDESVGIGWGPESVWARTLDGVPFELTDEETDEWSIYASENHQPWYDAYD